MEWITSAQNTKIKLVRSLKEKKERDHTGLYFLEGKRLVSEVAYNDIQFILVSEKYQGAIPSHPNVSMVNEKVFSIASDTQNPQGILAVCQKKKQDITWNGHFYILLENIKDPGNMGTMIRTADAFGVDGIFITKESVDIYNPKVLRSGMGSHFHLPLYPDVTVANFLEDRAEKKIRLIGAHLQGKDLFSLPGIFKHSTVLAIGNEAWGLSEELTKACDALVKIPITGSAESLNATMAGGILMYEACRQRNLNSIY